jgi:hypothetical protein
MSQDNRAGTIRSLSRFMKLDEDRTARIYDSVRADMSREAAVNVELHKKSL